MLKKNQTIRPLGSLEERLMLILWEDAPLSVREVNERLSERPLAHTTVMTTLDRLFKKGLLSRGKGGVAYIYRPALTQDTYRQRLVEVTISGLMSKGGEAETVLAAFVDAAAELDEENLAMLEALIATRRREGK